MINSLKDYLTKETSKKCVLCDKELLLRTHTFSENLGKETLTGRVYNCKCPIYFLDELIFIRDNNLDIPNIEILKALLEKKKSWITSRSFQAEHYDQDEIETVKASHWHHAINRYGSDRSTEDDRLAHEINSSIWRILYREYKRKMST